MVSILNDSTDAYFNLAAEEYLLRSFGQDVFMLWQNEPSVVIGKHQNVWAEINPAFIQERDIKVVRRFSGGGAVYHDLGNLNFTFIESWGAASMLSMEPASTVIPSFSSFQLSESSSSPLK